MIRSILFLLFCCFFVGCSMIPEFQRPEGATSNFWLSGENGDVKEKQAEETKLAADIPWREFFLSPDLQDVIELALENNRDLKTAILNVERARATYDIQEADRYPHLDGTAGADFAGRFDGQNTETYQVGLATTSYELDLFGRVKSLSDAALNDYLATEEAQKSINIALIAEAANSYLQLISDIESYELSKETLQAQQNSYDLIQQNYNFGVSTKLDLAQVRIAVETARSNKIFYARQVILDRNALTELLGVVNIDSLSIIKSLEDVNLLQDIPVGLPSQVLLKRPDIKQAEYVLKGAGANIGAARAAFYPKITLTGNLGFSSDELGDLFAGSSSGIWGFIPSLSVPIFNAGQNQARLEVAMVDQKIAITQYEKTIQQAFREVADELTVRDTTMQQLLAQQALVDASQDAYDLSLLRYTKGIDNFLNVLDAQRSLFDAQQGEIEIEKRSLSNKVSLYKVLGGGLAAKN